MFQIFFAILKIQQQELPSSNTGLMIGLGIAAAFVFAVIALILFFPDRIPGCVRAVLRFLNWIFKCLRRIKQLFLGRKPEKHRYLTFRDIEKKIDELGYSYDAEQDIFYSNLYAWQRDFGYCRFYDESNTSIGIILDCDPINFRYNGKEWMIEFWKGQYGMAAGCEIGIYTAEGPKLMMPGGFNATFYNCVGDDDLMRMSLTLKKNGVPLFYRAARHWWLTGFMLGEFSEPSELSIDVKIELKSTAMRNAFWMGLNEAGYDDEELTVGKYTIAFTFAKPHTEQPLGRVPALEWLQQRKNQTLCETYAEITEPYDALDGKMKAIQKLAPDLFDEIFNLGRQKSFYKTYDIINRQKR
jgi:hypothetical protein